MRLAYTEEYLSDATLEKIRRQRQAIGSQAAASKPGAGHPPPLTRFLCVGERGFHLREIRPPHHIGVHQKNCPRKKFFPGHGSARSISGAPEKIRVEERSLHRDENWNLEFGIWN